MADADPHAEAKAAVRSFIENEYIGRLDKLTEVVFGTVEAGTTTSGVATLVVSATQHWSSPEARIGDPCSADDKYVYVPSTSSVSRA